MLFLLNSVIRAGRETQFVGLSQIHHSRTTALTKLGYYMGVIDRSAHTCIGRRDHNILRNGLRWITEKYFINTMRSNRPESENIDGAAVPRNARSSHGLAHTNR
jgi:hypothetical protein